MKRLLMFKKRIQGSEFQAVDLSLAKDHVGANLCVRPLSVRETTRIHALTGVPWEEINREAEKGERI